MNGQNIIGLAPTPAAAALTPLGGSAPVVTAEAFAPFLAQATLGGGNILDITKATLPQQLQEPQKSTQALLSQANLHPLWPTSFAVKGDMVSAKQQQPLEDVAKDSKAEEKPSLNNQPSGEETAACLQAIQQILTEFTLGGPTAPISKSDLAQVTEVLARIPELMEQLNPKQIQELQSLIQVINQGLETGGRLSINQPVLSIKDAQTPDAKTVDLRASEFVEGVPEDNPTLQLSQKLKQLLNEQSSGFLEKGQAFVKPLETTDLQTQTSGLPLMELILPLTSAEPAFQAQTAHQTTEKVMAMPAALRENVFEQIVRSMNFSIKEGQSEMQIHLKPDFLGQMSMKIAVEDGLVAATFTVESHQVKELLESSLSNLRQSLTNQGLKVDTLTVSIGSGGAFSDLSQRQSNWAASTPPNNPVEEYQDAETEIAPISYDRALSWASSSMDYIV